MHRSHPLFRHSRKPGGVPQLHRPMGKKLSFNAPTGAWRSSAAATSSKINPQSHQNAASETPTARNAARWSIITTRQALRKMTLHPALSRTRRASGMLANRRRRKSTWKATCPSSSLTIRPKTARRPGSLVPSRRAQKKRCAIISGTRRTSNSSSRPKSRRKRTKQLLLQ